MTAPSVEQPHGDGTLDEMTTDDGTLDEMTPDDGSKDGGTSETPTPIPIAPPRRSSRTSKPIDRLTY